MSMLLAGSSRPLCEVFDVALLDLDGVVYVGPDAVPGAPAALATARDRGMHLAFVTNNAARPPAAVAAHLTDLGIPAVPTEIITSAQAAARYLGERLPVGARVLVVGATGLIEAVHERGLVPVDRAGESVAAVVQGYSPDLTWHLLAEGAVAINRGALWVATNVDPTVPSPRGPLPGNGSLVAALRHATGKTPTVTGKPEPTMHRETLLRTGARHPIVIGDRLDTDIEGANTVGCPSLLVLSGVTEPADLLVAPPRLRPTYIAADVAGLCEPQPAPIRASGGYHCGRWAARAEGDGVHLSRVPADAETTRETSDPVPSDLAGAAPSGRSGPPTPHQLDALRALCAASWEHQDARPSVVADGNPAAEVLTALGLA